MSVKQVCIKTRTVLWQGLIVVKGHLVQRFQVDLNFKVHLDQSTNENSFILDGQHPDFIH